MRCRPVRRACRIGPAARASLRRCTPSTSCGRAACSPKERSSCSSPTGSSATPTTRSPSRSTGCTARAAASSGSTRSCASRDSKPAPAVSRPCCPMSTNSGRSITWSRWPGWWRGSAAAATAPATQRPGCRKWRDALYSAVYNALDMEADMLSTDNDILKAAEDWRKKGRAVALATVVETWGSAPRPVGSNLVIDEEGNFLGSVSGGCVEGAVVTEALDVIESGKPKLLEFGVADETAWKVGLSCGGTIRVFVEKVE